VLITTYTQGNETEIKKKIIDINGCIPGNITVKTWFAFLIQHGAKPFQEPLYSKEINGLQLVNSQSTRYISKNDVARYYFNVYGQFYSDKLACFVVECNEKSSHAVLNRISRIFSRVYIDEVQDLAGYDLEIIKLLLKSKSHVLLIGDPRQVTYFTHNEPKNKQYNGNICNFIRCECKNIQCEIDTESLNVTYRNLPAICSFAERLYPVYGSIKSSQAITTEHDGIFFVKKPHVNDYMECFQPVQLRWDTRTKVNLGYPVYNMGISKGMEFNRVIIYPTKPITDWIEDNTSNLQPETRAKFYVAITRAKYSVAIVCSPNFRCDDSTIQVWSHE
jgi:DNA helicase-2/ATP-dependent DNA helicase PcrA